MRHTASATQPEVTVASPRYYELGRMSQRELERTLLRGITPDLECLVGWEFRGMNTPAWARLAGIKKFMKGFYKPEDAGGEVYGYNCPVVQNRLDQPWNSKPSNDNPRRFGFYKVHHVDAAARDNAYLHSALLDYSRGKNHPLDPSRGLRDYMVQVDPGNKDLYLGKAYYALGPARLGVSYFVLERLRRAPGAPVR